LIFGGLIQREGFSSTKRYRMMRFLTAVQPGVLLDPILVVLRVAEAIAAGLSMARVGWEPNRTRLGFAFRWTKLKGRRLEAWAYPAEIFTGGGTAHQDQIETFVEVPLDTPSSAIAPFVNDATRLLFALFDGFEMPLVEIEKRIQRLLGRNVGLPRSSG